MIPLKDENPTKRFPIVTVALLVANIAVFAYELFLPDEGLLALIETWAVVPAHLIAEPTSPTVLVTLLSAMFLHGGWLHLGGNMLYLWIFGNNVEDRFGRLRFLAFYLGTGVLATLAHVVASGPTDVPLIGASGAIAGILGSYLLLFPRTRVLVAIPIFFIIELARIPAYFVIGFWFLMQVIQGIGTIAPGSVTGGVAWWAHIGGFVAGTVVTLPLWFAEWRRRRSRNQQKFTTYR